MKVLIAGSRRWPETDEGREIIENAVVKLLLSKNPPRPFPWELLVGDCETGVDRIVTKMWQEWGHPHYVYSADWEAECRRTCAPGHRRRKGGPRGKAGKTYCPAAGPYRNERMVAEKPDACLVFPYGDDPNENKGTFDTANRAKRANIPVMVCTFDGKIRVY